MPIPKKKYIQLKAMYDFQRKVEYNKEKLRKAVEELQEDMVYVLSVVDDND